MCGIFGVFGSEEAARLAYLGLYSLQHRGQEAVGLVSTDSKVFVVSKKEGLVTAQLSEKELSRHSAMTSAVGHVRYSTAGESSLDNAQPLMAYIKDTGIPIALVHNGNLVNVSELKKEIQKRGLILTTSSDTELILLLIISSEEKFLIDKIKDAIARIRGAYSLIVLSPDSMFGLRDPKGFRPLVLGYKGKAAILASETCALDTVGGGALFRDIVPGEVVEIVPLLVQSNSASLLSYRFSRVAPPEKIYSCSFEYIYFSRPDSKLDGVCVDTAREEMGRRLAQEHPVEGDIVIPVPDSGISAAIGYAEESGIKFKSGLIRNHYMGRTFIKPDQRSRDLGVRLKFSASAGTVKGKRVIVVDDSLVRGTTSKKIIAMLRKAGAKEVHFRVSSPPVIGPCYYGIDTPTRKELIAQNSTLDEIKEFIGADSLGYLSIENMLNSIKQQGKSGLCSSCFTLKYPITHEV